MNAQAVQSLDETINDVFGGDDHINTNNHTSTGSSSGNSLPPSHSKTPSSSSNPTGRRVLNDGWVEIRGGKPTPSAAAFLDPLVGDTPPRQWNTGVGDGKGTVPVDGRSAGAGGVPAAARLGYSAGALAGPGDGYPGSFVMGNSGGQRRGGKRGSGRVFGVPLEELIRNPIR